LSSLLTTILVTISNVAGAWKNVAIHDASIYKPLFKLATNLIASPRFKFPSPNIKLPRELAIIVKKRRKSRRKGINTKLAQQCCGKSKSRCFIAGEVRVCAILREKQEESATVRVFN
jgi:hypothetical protein